MHAQSSSEMLSGSSNVKYLSEEPIQVRFEKETDKRTHVQVLEHLPEPETFHVIVFARSHIVDVVDTGIRDRRREVRLETLDGAGSVVEIFGIASHAPCIKVGFEDFWTHDIIRPDDVVAVLVVELDLLCCRCRAACVVAITGHVGK